MKSDTLRIIPLGGMGEVGRNMMVYEYNREILIVDTGLMFPENDMLGIDYIIPDMTYLKNKRDWVKGIIITHGHEDHTGAIRHVLEEINAPIYATPLTAGLLEGKLSRNGILDKTTIHVVNAGDTINIGKYFKVDTYHVSHSIPDGIGLGIETPAGLIVHSGDYKFDHTPVDNWPSDYAKLAEFSKRGVLALLSDSTNSERPGWTPSERVIEPALNKVFSEAKGRIIIASFASLISRMQQIANTAVKHNRKLAFAGTSMVDNVKIARKLGYLDVSDELIITLDQALNMSHDKVVIMCTGSQGEPTSILGRLAVGKNRSFDVIPGDTIVLSSHPIPGNEEAVSRTINRLFERGANVIYEAIAAVHVSGHASQEEMKLLMHLTKPKYFIPIHGELRHLVQHARLAKDVGIPEENISVVQNGQSIEFTNGKMRMGETFPGSYIFVDGSNVGDISPDVLREREMMAVEGIVLVNLLFNQKGQLSCEPQIHTRGFLVGRDEEELKLITRSKIQEVLIHANGNLQKDVEKAVRNVLYTETRRRPLVLISVCEVN
ncbi:MAG: ribonuclease J [Anaerolineaceae bacterium]|nr:ribonuclease J [Anaerolineaceae bacterium]